MNEKKRKLWIFLIIFMIVPICGFLIIKSLTSTNYSKLDKKFGIISTIYKYFNPSSLKEKSIYEIRLQLHKCTTKWSPKPIPFSNIKNRDIKTASNQVPVRIYTPIMETTFP